jgi:hypothetical protein
MEIRQVEINQNFAAIGVGGRSHSPFSAWRKILELVNQLSLAVKLPVRLVAHHPLFEHGQLFGSRADGSQRNLV